MVMVVMLLHCRRFPASDRYRATGRRIAGKLAGWVHNTFSDTEAML